MQNQIVHNNIYILYLCILEEHTGNCLILGESKSKLGYRAHAPKIKPSPMFHKKSLRRDNIYKLFLWILEKHIMPSINALACSKAEI